MLAVDGTNKIKLFLPFYLEAENGISCHRFLSMGVLWDYKSTCSI
jgi:hypothetical protein